MEGSGVNRLQSRRGFAYLVSILTMLSSNYAFAFDENNLVVTQTSVSALRAAGIAPQGAHRTGTLPISCNIVPNEWGVTISDRLYNAYRRRGFSKTAVCLALGGENVHFDPATGRQLPLY